MVAASLTWAKWQQEHPWVQGELTFAPEAIAAVEADACARYLRGEEACGFLSGPANEPGLCIQATPMENLANKLHALDPEMYFRNARTFFAFNEKRFDDAVRAGQRLAMPVKVLYHSHLDTGAYFSVTDQAVLSCGEPPEREGDKGSLGAGPAWPLAFLVTSVIAPDLGELTPRVAEHRLHIWNGERFVEGKFKLEGA
jgi:proteasome lid subunit RPN8/RPN11